jgi:ABC-2 type transport system ATP-binding protein
MFTVDPRSGVPLYLQLIEQVKRAVALGTLAGGEQLPTVKALALDLTINPNTVARVYRELERDGVIETSPGRARPLVSQHRQRGRHSMITMTGLSKRYGAFTAVDDLTLKVERGSICGLLGPNGAGKTTTFKCLLGFTRPTSGTTLIDGKPLEPAVFERLSYVPERTALYEWMTVRQHVEMQRRAFRRFDAERTRQLLELFALDANKRVKRLSKGQQTAVALVLAFSTRPEILILDEPASGLDPVFQRVVIDLMIDAAANGATILFSSHQITQVERAADHVAILRGGRLVVDGQVDALKSSEKIVEAIFDQSVPQSDGLAQDARVRRLERSGRILRAYVTADSDEIAKRIDNLGPRSVSVLDLNLEDIFLSAIDAERTNLPSGVLS